MKVHQYKITNAKDCYTIDSGDYDWVMCFGAKKLLEDEMITSTILEKFSNTQLFFCSTAGEICKLGVCDNSIIITAIKFNHTIVKAQHISINDFNSSYDAGQFLAKQLQDEKLKHIFIISDGSLVNGSELVNGLNEFYQSQVVITGGLAGDDTNFDYTITGLNEHPSRGNIIGFGLYGDHILITHSSMGGWDSFGLSKTVTRAVGNELFEINGRNALDFYSEQLGKYAEGLPGTALLFPLAVKLNDSDDSIVRTILSINNEKKSMIFAGDIPEGSKVKFMMANFDRLIDAAGSAAKNSIIQAPDFAPELAILISCVGRRIVLAGRTDEEIEAVQNELSPNIPIAGFYSYGEISPLNDGVGCQLHNQTMTITCFQEIE